LYGKNLFRTQAYRNKSITELTAGPRFWRPCNAQIRTNSNSLRNLIDFAWRWIL